MLTDEYRYKVLKLVEANPEISQRELAVELGISLGKANFCIQALIEIGFLKVKNFRNSKKKIGYVYFLTPKGLEEKSNVTLKFLKIKMHEFDLLKSEILKLKNEIDSHQVESLKKL